MPNHHEITKEVIDSVWFSKESPFVAQLHVGHPKLTIVTGPNASGKSFFRKVLISKHQYNYKLQTIHLSQAGRCQGGIVRAFLYGNEEDDSTGFNSAHTLVTAIKTGQARTEPFTLILDEPEIGCSEELQAALAIRLARDFETMPHLNGCFIITHSRQFVKQLLYLNPSHCRLANDNLTLNQWVEREIVPVESIEDLKEKGRECWQAVQTIINRTNKKK